MIPATGRYEAVRISRSAAGPSHPGARLDRGGRGGGGLDAMADVAYVLVVVGGFALLALVLRGLERL